jgi:hypothetical protein
LSYRKQGIQTFADLGFESEASGGSPWGRTIALPGHFVDYPGRDQRLQVPPQSSSAQPVDKEIGDCSIGNLEQGAENVKPGWLRDQIQPTALCPPQLNATYSVENHDLT